MVNAKPLSGVEENEMRRRPGLNEDAARALATLSHSRDVFGRMLVEAEDRAEAAAEHGYAIEARIVAWLRSLPSMQAPSALADAIERDEHLRDG